MNNYSGKKGLEKDNYGKLSKKTDKMEKTPCLEDAGLIDLGDEGEG
jgi:hypothetical protein